MSKLFNRNKLSLKSTGEKKGRKNAAKIVVGALIAGLVITGASYVVNPTLAFFSATLGTKSKITMDDFSIDMAYNNAVETTNGGKNISIPDAEGNWVDIGTEAKTQNVDDGIITVTNTLDLKLIPGQADANAYKVTVPAGKKVKFKFDVTPDGEEEVTGINNKVYVYISNSDTIASFTAVDYSAADGKLGDTNGVSSDEITIDNTSGTDVKSTYMRVAFAFEDGDKPGDNKSGDNQFIGKSIGVQVKMTATPGVSDEDMIDNIGVKAVEP